MEIVVLGPSEFTLGFQLTGVAHVQNPSDDKDFNSRIGALLSTPGVGIVIVPSTMIAQMPERLKMKVSESITPTVVAVGSEEDNTLRDSIKRAIGVDLWN